MLRGIANEDASSRTWLKFVFGSGIKIRITQTPECAEMSINRVLDEKAMVRCVMANGARGTNI
jgi:hypothetical protein